MKNKTFIKKFMAECFWIFLYSTFTRWISNFYGYGLDISWIWLRYRGVVTPYYVISISFFAPSEIGKIK